MQTGLLLRIGGVAACFGASLASAQTVINGSSLALRSSGVGSGGAWTLHDNGYVGAYLTLAAPGEVSLSVSASGQSAVGVAPRMNLTVGDQSASFDVGAGFQNYAHTFSLPAGTHFVRADFNNDLEKSARSLTIGSLTATGAQAANANTSALALAAANTYIEHGRQGDVRLKLVGAEPGAPVRVELRRHAFNFGAAAANPIGTNYFWAVNPAPGSTVDKYQQFLKSHFNMLVPENAGKWSNNEFVRDAVNMGINDAIVAFAESNGMRMRQHNLLWSDDAGSPAWVNSLIAQAVGGSPSAKAELLAEIHERIAYYVGDGVGPERARDYFELDVLNEGLHEGEFRAIFGDAGLADVFNAVAASADGGGAEVKLYVNEYNVLQFSDNPAVAGYSSDNYANWFREHGEAIERAGGQVDGYGVQYYALLDANANANSPHSPARMQQVFQNLSLTGKSFGLTEFGVQNSGSPSGAAVADALEETMRMTFGSPRAETFNMWGFWANAMWSQATLGALVDANWNLTPAGQRYEQLMAEWDVDAQLVIDGAGMAEFRGFYGDYDVSVDGRVYNLSVVKGQSDYELVVRLAGDFDQDNDVDGDDLSRWQVEFGVGAAADADGDGDADGADLLAWQRQFGTAGSPFELDAAAETQAVPEGAAVLLMALALGAVARVAALSRKRDAKPQAEGV
ncbi:MAG: hypothetical protein DCC67_14520 [Planctomycetota bacterium]|nr:MAG: hypothetical protein DCC67_14520 [Planctomycetota bacterium]